MADKKSLCAMIDADLHRRVREAQERAGQTLSDYITTILTEYLEGGHNMNEGKTRTLAFQVSEELFQKVKAYVAGHKGLTQKDFVVRLIERAIADWEAESADGGAT